MKNINLLIFKNDRKTKDTHPDYDIKMKVGENFESIGGGWKKTSAKGTNFISVSVQAVPLWNILKSEINPDAPIENSANDIL